METSLCDLYHDMNRRETGIVSSQCGCFGLHPSAITVLTPAQTNCSDCDSVSQSTLTELLQNKPKVATSNPSHVIFFFSLHIWSHTKWSYTTTSYFYLQNLLEEFIIIWLTGVALHLASNSQVIWQEWPNSPQHQVTAQNTEVQMYTGVCTRCTNTTPQLLNGVQNFSQSSGSLVYCEPLARQVRGEKLQRGM